MTDFDHGLVGHVDRALTEFLDAAVAPVAHVEPFAEATRELRRFVLNGGKRLRPTFAWWAWRAAGGPAAGPSAKGALHAVSALELIQGCALVHDDLMDDSDERRGAPTVHVTFSTLHADRGWHGASQRFGAAAAILIGDLSLAWADDMFATAPLPAETLAAARPVWQAMRTEVLAGQYLDIHTQATGNTSAEAAAAVNELKTAAYTVARPLHLGAALAGADAETVDVLRSFGHDIGVAFQLRDDLLGVFGDPAVTGKPAGDDLREGKRTLLIARGFELARDGDADAISAALGASELSASTLDAARSALVDAGAVDAVEKEIAELTARATGTLNAASISDAAREQLLALARAATDRRA